MGGVDAARLEISDKVASADGQECIIVQSTIDSKSERQKTYWVDPARNYAVVHIEKGRTGTPPVYTIDMKYAQMKDGEWFPSEWRIIHTGGQATKVINQVDAADVTVEVNVPVDSSTFDLDFPANTAVVDNRTGEKYIARINGEKRIVTKDELSRGASYKELNSTESGQARAPIYGEHRRSLVAIFGALAGAVCVTVYVTCRTRTRRRAG
jgi:hypothetical protein